MNRMLALKRRPEDWSRSEAIAMFGDGNEGHETMPVEIIGMVGTRDASEIKGPLVDGPTVDWLDGPVIDPDYLVAISRAHEDSDFDRVLIGYGAVGPRAGPSRARCSTARSV